ncbi:hypothetical protein ACNQFN_09345 [Thauera butanivorans]|uniref:hypothetical protein n=1 Tax=Thauera butanivorans TaxID=86174 RepID=UPI003AB6750E
MAAETRLSTPQGVIVAERIINGVPINPHLPEGFDATANEDRPPSHAKFWHRPYVLTCTVQERDAFYAGLTDEDAEAARAYWAKTLKQWMAVWPSGTCYVVRCLDGSAWNRSSSWGCFATLEEAIEEALVIARGE